jgi:hypothetical protein
MVNAHGIVGRNGPINKGPFGFTCIGIPPFLENIILFPEIQDFVLNGNEVSLGVYALYHI